jgi:hypothetical protein
MLTVQNTMGKSEYRWEWYFVLRQYWPARSAWRIACRLSTSVHVIRAALTPADFDFVIRTARP